MYQSPQSLAIPKIYQPAVKSILENEGMGRIAGFQWGRQVGSTTLINSNGLPASFKLFSPKIHGIYEHYLDMLYAEYPEQKRPWKSSKMPACTFNLGPGTATYPHKDAANLAWGWCFVTALGHFDHVKGGHIVLWELGLVIEFPAGSTALIPSAVVTHSNAGVQEGEIRYSFTSYAAAGLFSWVYNGFRSDADISNDPAVSQKEKEDRAEERRSRWKEALKLWPHLYSL